MTRPRDLRDRALASVRCPGLGTRLLATSDEARAGYDYDSSKLEDFLYLTAKA